MPNRPPRVCTKCRKIAPAGERCPCTPAWQGSAWGGGSTRKWRNLRAAKLNQDPICQAPQCNRPATEVDHITPLAHGGHRYDWANIQSLCEPHHAEKTAADAKIRRYPPKNHAA